MLNLNSPAVEFCGYTIPHPSDPKMHLRIQTTGQFAQSTKITAGKHHSNILLESTTALEALEKGFSDLMDLCDVVTEKFTAARDQFNEENRNRMQA